MAEKIYQKDKFWYEYQS